MVSSSEEADSFSFNSLVSARDQNSNDAIDYAPGRTIRGPKGQYRPRVMN